MGLPHVFQFVNKFVVINFIERFTEVLSLSVSSSIEKCSTFKRQVMICVNHHQY